MKGGEKGPSVVPGKADESLLVRHDRAAAEAVHAAAEEGGQAVGRRDRADAGVDGRGAHRGRSRGRCCRPAPVEVPKIEPKVPPRRPVRAVAYEPKGKVLAVARRGRRGTASAPTGRRVLHALGRPSWQRERLGVFLRRHAIGAAAGDPGAAGEVRLWNVADGKLAPHASTVTRTPSTPSHFPPTARRSPAAATTRRSSSGTWRPATPLRTLEGHNGAVFGLSFRNDGKVLASASGDRTMKLWDVATGGRLDTRPESRKELNAVLFSPDGKRVLAGGVDNRIRIWQVSPERRRGDQPARHVAVRPRRGRSCGSRVSADGKTLVSSADDGTVKLWDAADLTARSSLSARAARLADRARVRARRQDACRRPARRDARLLRRRNRQRNPAAQAAEARGGRTGPTRRAAGARRRRSRSLARAWCNYQPPRSAALRTGKLSAKVLPDEAGGDSGVGRSDGGRGPPAGFVRPDRRRTRPARASRSSCTSTRCRRLRSRSRTTRPAAAMPVVAAGQLLGRVRPGRATRIISPSTPGPASQSSSTSAARRIGSKASVGPDAAGPGRQGTSQRLRASTTTPTRCSPSPPPRTAGTSSASTDVLSGSSKEHFYRLSVGPFAYVTGVLPAGRAGERRIARALARLQPAAGRAGEGEGRRRRRDRRAARPRPLPQPRGRSRSRFRRRRKSSRLSRTTSPSRRRRSLVPGSVSGRIDAPRGGTPRRGPVPLRRRRPGRKYVIETLAQRRGSPVDTRVEVLWPDGRPVERVQAARRSATRTSTSAPSTPTPNGARFQNWEEMDLNQYVYMAGEVVKLFLAPRGPDSEYNFYTVPERQTPLLLRHHRHQPRAGRAVVRRRAPPARRKTAPQRPAGFHAPLRQRRRRRPHPRLRFAAAVHRPGRRRLPRPRHRHPRLRRRPLRLPPDRPTRPAGLRRRLRLRRPHRPGRRRAELVVRARPRRRLRRPGARGPDRRHRRLRGFDAGRHGGRPPGSQGHGLRRPGAKLPADAAAGVIKATASATLDGKPTTPPHRPRPADRRPAAGDRRVAGTGHRGTGHQPRDGPGRHAAGGPAGGNHHHSRQVDARVAAHPPGGVQGPRRASTSTTSPTA